MTASNRQVFISYQRTDEAFARQVRERLVEAGVRAWMDQYDIPVGAYWPDEIDKALTSSDIVVGILSPDAVDSRNVKNEWDWAIQNDKRLLLLQVEPCVIPHRYVSINHIDATGSDPSTALTALVETLGISDSTDDFETPETRYARSGDVNIAYQVVGDGPIDLVFVPGFVSNIEILWEGAFGANLQRLCSLSRLILLDKRGTGLSDRVNISELPTLEDRMDDVRAVMDAAGSERAILLGYSEGGPMSVLFATTYPERTLGLILVAAVVTGSHSSDSPWAPIETDVESFYEHIREHWGDPNHVILDVAPDYMDDPDFRDWLARLFRFSASPAAAEALCRMNGEIDVRDILDAVRVPTLILHRTGDRVVQVEQSRYLAEHIHDARYVELPGTNHIFAGSHDDMLDEIESFVAELRSPESGIETILATVLRIDDVGTNGSSLWTNATYTSMIDQTLMRFRGRSVGHAIAQFTATFDGPSRAIRCAAAILNNDASRNIALRAGIHTGEIEIAESKVRGMAIDIASAVASTAEPGETIASRTVKDLAAGSGIVFKDRGTHTFDGIPDEWQLFRVDPDSI